MLHFYCIFYCFLLERQLRKWSYNTMQKIANITKFKFNFHSLLDVVTGRGLSTIESITNSSTLMIKFITGKFYYIYNYLSYI